MNVFITGVARGIGLALTAEALQRGHTVYGVARNPEGSEALLKLRQKYPSLQLLKLDLTEEGASERLEMELTALESIDVVINNAGVYEKGVERDSFRKSFEINSFVPFMVAQTLLPKLKRSRSPKLVSISSTMGSIEENTSGGSVAYRASKAALNMINKCLSLEHDWLVALVMHPGWVQTDMGGTSAPTTTEESSQGIWRVIEELEKKDSGGFRDYQGRELPW